MKKDLTGQTFGELTVAGVHSKTRNGHYRYLCKCSCGNTHTPLGTHLLSGKITHCGCKKAKGKQSACWTGYEEISGDYWYAHVTRSANGTKGRRELDCNITKEYMWDLFIKQNRKCALSGLELSFPKTNEDQSYTASIDRIDSSLGYIEGNVQWVHKDINMMKNKYNQEYFIQMCKLISENSGGSCEITRI